MSKIIIIALLLISCSCEKSKPEIITGNECIDSAIAETSFMAGSSPYQCDNGLYVLKERLKKCHIATAK